MSADRRVAEVLAFWFGEPAERALGRPREAWFRKDDGFDAAIRARFGELVDEARAGGLAGWESDDHGALSLLVVCDQFPRNIFRGNARAFALDARALALAKRFVAEGRDARLRPVERAFVYLPFEHAESLADQREAVRLFDALRDDPDAGGYHAWAVRHLGVIERFGRFPHRNEALGRTSTAQELAFLAQPGSRF